MDLFNRNTEGGNTLPQQRLPMSRKTKDWGKACINFYSNYRYTNGTSLRSDRFRKLINYDLYNAKINHNDVETICNPLGLSDSSWANRFQHYDVISEAIRLLEGEESKRPDTFMVVSESTDDINRKQDNLKKRILESLQQMLMAEVDPTTIDPNNPPQTPEQVVKYSKYNVTDLIESKANKALKHLKKYLNLKQVFSLGWKDALIAGEEIYWSGIVNGEVAIRRVNPINLTVILDDDTQYVDEAVAVIEERMLTIASILDEYGDDLTDGDLETLEEYSRGVMGSFGTAGGYSPQFTVQDGQMGRDGATITGSYQGNNINNYSIRVVRVEWLSMKQVGTLTYTDEQGQLQSDMVDESFILSKFKELYPDASVEWFWINEAWEGIKIGEDVYVGMRPKPNQRRRMDNPYYAKLGYNGYIYEATNSQSVSVVDRLKPYQYLYDIIMYRLELAFASDQGKVFLMDVAQIPESHGIDRERWLYYLKEMKIGFINSFEEGKRGTSIGQRPAFNQFQAIDLSLAQSIQQYINYLDYIKNQIYFVSGITPQRLGAVSSNELVGNVERAVNQSALITEYLFEAHDEVKRRVYTSLLEVFKIAARDGYKTQYILDDMGVELLNIEELEFENSEFNVYMTNSSKDLLIKQKLENLMDVAIKAQKADLSTMVDALMNDSIQDISHILKDAEAKFYEREQQNQQMQQQMQQEQIAAQNQMHQEKLAFEQQRLDLEQYKIDADNQTKLQVAQINVYSRQENLDQDGDGTPDPLEVGKLALEQQDVASRAFLEREKISHDRDKHNKELALKDKELQMKKSIEEKKIEAIKVQNQSQEKIANAANKLKEKEMANKLKIERIKARNKNKSK
jgi:hypothetical protein